MSKLEDALALCQVQGRAIIPPTREQLELTPEEWTPLKKLMNDNHAKWKGGNKQHFEFPFDPESLLADFQAGLRPNFKQDFHYFPTPEPVIEAMFNIHICLYDGLFLEPSAGQGAIPDWITKTGAPCCEQRWQCIEVHPLNQQHIKDKGYDLVGADFDNWEAQPVYDDIYANPPFKRDRQHLAKMADCVREGGSIVCVLPGNFEEKKPNQEVIEMLHDRFMHVEFHATKDRVYDQAFKKTGTCIETSILYAAHMRSPKRERILTPVKATRTRTRRRQNDK